MRASFADAALARYAGRFVWLDLNFDKESNQAFVERHGVQWTPTLLVLDPADERVTAQHNGGVTVDELREFLERGERGMHTAPTTESDLAQRRGDELAGKGRFADAAVEYRNALAAAPSAWAGRARTVDALTSGLLLAGEEQSCAEEAIRFVPTAARDRTFARVVRTGLSCANTDESAPWARGARKTLEPLAAEAVAFKDVLRNDHFELLQNLIISAQLRGDPAAARRWGDRWLTEIDGSRPRNDDERSALDIARLDAVLLLDEPERALPALAASEKAMPRNYTASMRYAEAALHARHFDDAVAASKRGLALVDGPMGRTRLLWIQAEAWVGKGQRQAARGVLDEAMASARTIPSQNTRDHYLRRLQATSQDIERL